MEYYVTFSDGTSAYLEHFGVKGMHWGVWNAETRARRMGGGTGAKRKGSSGESSSTSSSGRHLTDKQKKMLKGAAIGIGTAAAIGGGVYLAKKAADRNLDNKLKDQLLKARIDQGSRLKANAEMVKEDLFEHKVRNHLTDEKYKRSVRDLAGVTRYLSNKNPSQARYDAASMKIGFGSPNNLYRLVDATLDYKMASAAAKAQHKKGKRLVNKLAKMGALGAVVGGAGAGVGYYKKSSKSKSSTSKRTYSDRVKASRKAARNLTSKGNALANKNDINAVMKLVREYDEERKRY